MILARRVTGHLIRFYPLPSLQPRSTIAWSFEPSPFCSLVRQELSGPGTCAVAKTIAEARAALIVQELLIPNCILKTDDLRRLDNLQFDCARNDQ